MAAMVGPSTPMGCVHPSSASCDPLDEAKPSKPRLSSPMQTQPFPPLSLTDRIPRPPAPTNPAAVQSSAAAVPPLPPSLHQSLCQKVLQARDAQSNIPSSSPPMSPALKPLFLSPMSPHTPPLPPFASASPVVTPSLHPASQTPQAGRGAPGVTNLRQIPSGADERTYGGMKVGMYHPEQENLCRSPSWPSHKRKRHEVQDWPPGIPCGALRMTAGCPSPHRLSNCNSPVLGAHAPARPFASGGSAGEGMAGSGGDGWTPSKSPRLMPQHMDSKATERSPRSGRYDAAAAVGFRNSPGAPGHHQQPPPPLQQQQQQQQSMSPASAARLNRSYSQPTLVHQSQGQSQQRTARSPQMLSPFSRPQPHPHAQPQAHPHAHGPSSAPHELQQHPSPSSTPQPPNPNYGAPQSAPSRAPSPAAARPCPPCPSPLIFPQQTPHTHSLQPAQAPSVPSSPAPMSSPSLSGKPALVPIAPRKILPAAPLVHPGGIPPVGQRGAKILGLMGLNVAPGALPNLMAHPPQLGSMGAHVGGVMGMGAGMSMGPPGSFPSSSPSALSRSQSMTTSRVPVLPCPSATAAAIARARASMPRSLSAPRVLAANGAPAALTPTVTAVNGAGDNLGTGSSGGGPMMGSPFLSPSLASKPSHIAGIRQLCQSPAVAQLPPPALPIHALPPLGGSPAVGAGSAGAGSQMGAGANMGGTRAGSVNAVAPAMRQAGMAWVDRLSNLAHHHASKQQPQQQQQHNRQQPQQTQPVQQQERVATATCSSPAPRTSSVTGGGAPTDASAAGSQAGSGVCAAGNEQRTAKTSIPESISRSKGASAYERDSRGEAEEQSKAAAATQPASPSLVSRNVPLQQAPHQKCSPGGFSIGPGLAALQRSPLPTVPEAHVDAAPDAAASLHKCESVCDSSVPAVSNAGPPSAFAADAANGVADAAAGAGSGTAYTVVAQQHARRAEENIKTEEQLQVHQQHHPPVPKQPSNSQEQSLLVLKPEYEQQNQQQLGKVEHGENPPPPLQQLEEQPTQQCQQQQQQQEEEASQRQQHEEPLQAAKAAMVKAEEERQALLESPDKLDCTIAHTTPQLTSLPHPPLGSQPPATAAPAVDAAPYALPMAAAASPSAVAAPAAAAALPVGQPDSMPAGLGAFLPPLFSNELTYPGWPAADESLGGAGGEEDGVTWTDAGLMRAEDMEANEMEVLEWCPDGSDGVFAVDGEYYSVPGGAAIMPSHAELSVLPAGPGPVAAAAAGVSVSDPAAAGSLAVHAGWPAVVHVPNQQPSFNAWHAPLAPSPQAHACMPPPSFHPSDPSGFNPAAATAGAAGSAQSHGFAARGGEQGMHMEGGEEAVGGLECTDSVVQLWGGCWGGREVP
ncbi:unnamed protein product [Closterium sp. Naga37s-1]|nr:unnamed protein product [Closterium sp. Naga37s-1]